MRDETSKYFNLNRISTTHNSTSLFNFSHFRIKHRANEKYALIQTFSYRAKTGMNLLLNIGIGALVGFEDGISIHAGNALYQGFSGIVDITETKEVIFFELITVNGIQNCTIVFFSTICSVQKIDKSRKWLDFVTENGL